MQFELEFQEDSLIRAQERKFIDLLREVVEAKGLKVVAAQLDVAPSYLSHALAGRNRYPVRAEWVPTLVAMAPNNDVVDYLAGLRGGEVVPAKELDPETEAKAWAAAISELDPDFAQLLKQKMRAKAKEVRR